ncbi:MAG: transglutaminase-like domain-containing protein [Rhodobacterales bacterium]
MKLQKPDPLLAPTRLLDFDAEPIAKLIQDRNWPSMTTFERIGAIYDFVRNEIAFGYNRVDDIPASQVLADGFGQCNTKGTLLMALLRGVGIRCRLHGFTIHKGLQRGVVPELVYPLAPHEILHSWVEIDFEGAWVNLEGFILDEVLLKVLQASFPSSNSLCGYGAGTDCLSAPPVTWDGQDTYIQRTGIVQDFGLFDTPDSFYAAHEQSFGWLKGVLYRHIIRHWMNARVRALRIGRLQADARVTHSHSKTPDAA